MKAKHPLDALLEELDIRRAMPSLASLHHLSTLEPEEAMRVREVWMSLSVDLRRRLIARLVEMAEADFELDFGAIFRFCLEDRDAEVRAAAVEGLWEDEDVRLVPVLAACLLEDEAVTVRAAAAASLGRFILLGELRKIRPDPHNMAYEALMTAWHNAEEHLEVRRRALESLAYSGEEAVAELIGAAYEDPDEKMHVSAIFAMGRSADDRWAWHVRQELFSPNPELRYEAARACGELELHDTVPDLEELTQDVDPEVQDAALWALGQIGGERAREILEHYCRSEDEALRTSAEAALRNLEFLHGDLDDLFALLLR